MKKPDQWSLFFVSVSTLDIVAVIFDWRGILVHKNFRHLFPEVVVESTHA